MFLIERQQHQHNLDEISGLASSIQAAELKPCYLTRMPPDIQNRIARLLPFYHRETKEKFIERTQTTNIVHSDIFSLYKTVPQASSNIANAVWCPDQTKFILFESFTNPPQPKFPITIVDIYKKQSLYTEQLEKYASALALSRGGTMFAVLRDTSIPYRHVLAIKDIHTQKAQGFNVSECPCHTPAIIGFNKQNTEIIVHYKKDAETSAIGNPDENKCIVTDDTPYLIFPLVSPEEVMLKEQLTLREYFRVNRVCQMLGNNM